MALDWNGYITKLADMGSTSVESRIHRQIAFAAIVGVGLILLWKVLK